MPRVEHLISKKEILKILASFLLGALLMYIYVQNEIKTSKDNSYKILQNSENTLSVSHDLIGNYQSVLDLMNSCLLLNPDTCNKSETANKVIQLGKERENLTEKLVKYTRESKNTFDHIRQNNR